MCCNSEHSLTLSKCCHHLFPKLPGMMISLVCVVFRTGVLFILLGKIFVYKYLDACYRCSGMNYSVCQFCSVLLTEACSSIWFFLVINVW